MQDISNTVSLHFVSSSVLLTLAYGCRCGVARDGRFLGKNCNFERHERLYF